MFVFWELTKPKYRWTLFCLQPKVLKNIKNENQMRCQNIGYQYKPRNLRGILRILESRDIRRTKRLSENMNEDYK